MMESVSDKLKRKTGWYLKDIREALESIPKEDMCLACWTYPLDGRCGCKFGYKTKVDNKYGPSYNGRNANNITEPRNTQ